MSEGTALLLALGSAILAIVYGAVSVGWVLAKPAGNDRMQEIAAAIQEGAKAYMNRQYSTIAVVGVLFVVLRLALEWRRPSVSPSAPSSRHWPATSACSYRYAPTYAPLKLPATVSRRVAGGIPRRRDHRHCWWWASACWASPATTDPERNDAGRQSAASRWLASLSAVR